MLMQTFGVTNKGHYGKLWYFLEWSIVFYLKFSFFHVFSVKRHPGKVASNKICTLCFEVRLEN